MEILMIIVSVTQSLCYVRRRDSLRLTLMLYPLSRKNAQECATCGCAQAWTGRGVLDRTSSPVRGEHSRRWRDIARA